MNKRLIKNQKGMATLESVTLLFALLILVAFMFGGFGIIHSSILNSISARFYAFEVFRHRTDLTYFRGNLGGDKSHYERIGYRTHAVTAENSPNDSNRYPTERPISIGMRLQDDWTNRNEGYHNQQIYTGEDLTSFGRRNKNLSVNPVWVMVQYGICVNSTCKDVR